MIRKATHEDIPRIVEMGAEFHAYGPYSWADFDREALGGFLGRLIDGGVILLSDEGMIGGVLSPLYFNPGVVMAAELFWWAKSGGRALRDAFEAWALEQGAAGVQFSGLANEREPAIRRSFERAGYGAAEIGFLKRF